MEIVIKLNRLKLPNACKSPAENIFQEISDETGAVLRWEPGSKPSKEDTRSKTIQVDRDIPAQVPPLTSGTNQKVTQALRANDQNDKPKDPCIKISGTKESVNKARDMLLEKLEVQSNRVVMKLEVSHLEHPSLIGKFGMRIKKVMEATGCHIHFPDANIRFPDRVNKNNQVSIYGEPTNVERARVMIRALIPIQIHFDVPKTSFFDAQILNSIHPSYDCYLPKTKFLGTYNGLLLYSAARQSSKIYIIRCNQDQFSHLRKDIAMLIEHICGTNGTNLPPVHMATDIMQQHHSFVRGPNNSNIEGIVKRTGAKITFPDKNSPKSEERSIAISGSLDSVYVAWLEIMNYLPVSVSFDVNSTRETEGEYMDFLRDLGIDQCTTHNTKYLNIKNVTLKGPEKFSKQMLQYRQHLLRLRKLCFRDDMEDIKLASDFLAAFNEYLQSSPVNTIPSSVTKIMSRNIGYETLQQLTQSLNSTAANKQLLTIANNSVIPGITNGSIINKDQFAIPGISNGSIINKDQFVETGHYYISTTKDFEIQAHPLLLAVEQSRTSSIEQITQNENGYCCKSKVGENSNAEDQLLMNNNWIKNIPFENAVPSGFSEMSHNQSLTEQNGKNCRLPQCLFMENQNGETTLAQDYYRKKALASIAMRRPIESTQVPTSLWAGYGFSQSMPPLKPYNHCQFSDSSSENLEKSWGNVMKNMDIWSNEKEAKLSHSNYFDFLRRSLPFDTNEQTKDILPELLWKHGLHQHIDTFTKQEIDFQAFLMLTDHDLQILGIAHHARVKLVCLIRELQESTKKNKTFDAAPVSERKSSRGRLDNLQMC